MMKTIMLIALMLSFGLSTAQAKDRISYFHSDISGSPIAATNDSGDVLWEETYKPYGERLNTDNSNKANNNQWFTGKQEEADLGLQYFGARWYHQASGRFISRDPAGVLAHVENNPMMFNRYAYGNNNPYKYVDPDGRNAIAAVLLVGAFFVADVMLSINHENAPGDDSIRAVGEGSVLGIFGKALKGVDTVRRVTKKGLPKNPDNLKRSGYTETSHPKAAKRGHRTFENADTGDKVRFDKGKPGANGYEGTDHYHRYNPRATGKKDQYLDKNGNPCARGCDASHLLPGD